MKPKIGKRKYLVLINETDEFIQCGNCNSEFQEREYVLIPYPHIINNTVQDGKVAFMAVCLDCMDEYFDTIGGFNAIREAIEEGGCDCS